MAFNEGFQWLTITVRSSCVTFPSLQYSRQCNNDDANILDLASISLKAISKINLQLLLKIATLVNLVFLIGMWSKK